VPGAAAWDWPIGTPQSQGMDAAALARTLDAGADLRALRSLLVVRNGVLVAERYYGNGTADDLFGVQSVTKSVSSCWSVRRSAPARSPACRPPCASCCPRRRRALPMRRPRG